MHSEWGLANRNPPMKPAIPFLLALLLAPATAVAAPTPIEAHLEATGYSFEVDGDGDFVTVIGWSDDDRSQVVYVAGHTNPFGGTEVREVFSPVMRVPEGGLDRTVANRLLRDSQERVMGSWEVTGDMLLYVVKLPEDMGVEALQSALNAAAVLADNMENELTGGRDDF